MCHLATCWLLPLYFSSCMFSSLEQTSPVPMYGLTSWKWCMGSTKLSSKRIVAGAQCFLSKWLSLSCQDFQFELFQCWVQQCQEDSGGWQVWEGLGMVNWSNKFRLFRVMFGGWTWAKKCMVPRISGGKKTLLYDGLASNTINSSHPEGI